MGYQPTEQERITLRDLNAGFRFAIVGPNHEEDERTGRIRQTTIGHVVCDMQDLATGEFYAKATGADEAAAFQNCLAVALRAEKPLTPAQKLHAAVNAPDDKDAEIARLKARLAEVEGNKPKDPADAPSKGKSTKPAMETHKVRSGVEVL